MPDGKPSSPRRCPGSTPCPDISTRCWRGGDWPLTVLPRCAAALATIPIIARHRPDAVIVWFDAHADLNTPQSSHSGYLGGLALSGPLGLWETGLGDGLDISNVVLVGARDIDPPERDLIAAQSVPLVSPGPEIATRLRRAVAGRPVYVHLDCDVLEPGPVPTEYVVPDGLTLDDLSAASAVLSGGEVVGLEIAEFQPARTQGAPAVSPAPLIATLMPVIEKGGP